MDSEDPSTGIRVTRSLRKRLTSVDSDASSRPSTPQLTKLTTIAETSSPTRALRGTRRNSTTLSGTPLKTPAKSKTASIHESNEAEIVPAKRITRKNSISLDLQTGLKVSPMDKLPSNVKEIDEMDIKDTPAKRTRRSEVEKTPRSGAVKKKPGPKSRRQKQESESESDIEVINLDDEHTDGKENVNGTTSITKDNLTKTPIRTSPRLKSKSVSPKDTAVVIETIDLLEDTKTSHHTEECYDNSTLSLRTEMHQNINISHTKIQSINTNEGEGVNLESLGSFKTEDTLVKETETENKSNNTDSFDHYDVNVDATAKNPNKSFSSLNSPKPCVRSVVILEKLSPKVMHKICSKKTSISSPSNSKSVTFNDNDVEDEFKISYPKTPVSIKSKSYLALDSTNESNNQSIQSDKESNNSFKDASEHIEVLKENNAFGVQANDSKDSVEFHDATNTVEELDHIHEVDEIASVSEHTPQKKKISGKLQSSTPMLDSVLNSKTESEMLVTNSPVRINALEETVSKLNEVESSLVKQNENTAPISQHDHKGVKKTNDKRVSLSSVDANLSNHGEKQEDLFSKSWTHTVSGCATSDGKIDTLSVNANDEKDDDEALKVFDEQKSSPNVSTCKETPDENDELKEEEEQFQKLEFVDDEAMEVDDNYQSGDSMDEEERKEMMENEILDEGESIGSEDTEESNDENDEENENASFITSDSGGSLLDYSDNDEDLENDIKKSYKKNTRNRILITSESEDNCIAIVSTTNSNKKNKSNVRNRILSSSESETEQQASKAFERINKSRKSSDNSENSLNLQVSRIMDDTTDDDDDVKESTESQLEMKASNNIGTKCSDNQEVEIKNEEDSRDGQETKNEAELNTSQERKTVSETTNASAMKDQCNIENTIGQKSRRSQRLSKSICENIAENSHDNEENFHVPKESNKEHSIFREETNTLRRSMERRSINSGHDCNKATETIDDAEINSADNKNYPQSDSDSSDNINMQMKADEDPELNSLEDMQSLNVSKDAENADDEDIEIPETQEVGKASEQDSLDELAVEEGVEELEDLSVGKSESKLKNSGLSLSFCQTRQKPVTVKDRIRHSSFTIGVSVTKLVEAGSSSSDEEIQCSDSNDSDRNPEIDKQNEEELEKLTHSNVQFFNRFRKRKSMLSIPARDNQENPCNKKTKRNSMQSVTNEDFNPSKSLLEYIEEQKRELQSQKDAQKTRLSKSFCGPIQNDMETFVDSGSDTDVANNTSSDKINRKGLQNTEQVTHSTASKSRLSKSLCEPIQEVPTTVGESSRSENSGDEIVNKNVNDYLSREFVKTKNKNRDFGRILDRCDEILDAANHAKLESKQKYKKSRIIIPKSKKESKHSLLSDEESASDTHQFKKDMKHSKEKTTLALEQAFKASANILLRAASKVKKEKQSLQKNEEKYADKRLPMQLLESISNSQSHNEIKKSKRERAREPLVQRLNCATGEIVEEVLSPPKKKRALLNKIELPTGTVLEEPVTPKKKTSNSGFRESPITPRTLGFKVRHILTAGQDKVPQLPTSHGIERKRKQKILDPKLVLPKPQWSQSGVFLEEILPTHKMQGLNTMKTCGLGVNEATVNALNFKTSTLFRKNVPREASHEILKRKERQYVRGRF